MPGPFEKFCKSSLLTLALLVSSFSFSFADFLFDSTDFPSPASIQRPTRIHPGSIEVNVGHSATLFLFSDRGASRPHGFVKITFSHGWIACEEKGGVCYQHEAEALYQSDYNAPPNVRGPPRFIS
jgi:hypothetical protein